MIVTTLCEFYVTAHNSGTLQEAQIWITIASELCDCTFTGVSKSDLENNPNFSGTDTEFDFFYLLISVLLCHLYPFSLFGTPAAIRQKSSMGGSIQVGERHISMERGLAAAGRPIAAATEAGGCGIRRLQLIQGGSLVQAGVSEWHWGRPTGEEDKHKTTVVITVREFLVYL